MVRTTFSSSRLTQRKVHSELIEIGTAQSTQPYKISELIKLDLAQSTQPQNNSELIEITQKYKINTK